ncbi:glycoside hydrolase family 108 protein [Agrobacterium sp. 22094]|uniref:glycoside hydrolase family 108 protein n=1 Tax=Agrobacterium sp. 22094 TaxID=3453872 RepID=UPI003F87FF79
MRFNFLPSLKLTLKSEGGNVDDKRDPGGRTSRGIIQTVYDTYRRTRKLPLRDVWTATEDEVADIYRTQYADKLRFDDLPVGVDFVVFDAGVNSGVSRGAKWLQSALGVSSDGVVGAKTIAAASAVDPVKLIKSVCANRLSFVRSLTTLFKTFGKGWTSRISFTEANGIAMSMKASGSTASQVADFAQLESASAKKSAKASSGAAAGKGVGSGTAATQLDWPHLTTFEIGFLAAGAIGIIVLVVFLIHRSRIQSSRADAYAAVAAEGAAA